MRLEPVIQFVNTKVLKSPLSKLFMMLSIVSLSLSMMNKTPIKLLGAELFIYTSLAITTNCLIYGDCHLSAMLILFAPIMIILVNMFELSGFKTHQDIVNKFQRLEDVKDPSFLTKTNKEKQEHIQRILKRSDN